MADYGIDWSILGGLGDTYERGRTQAREEELRRALQGGLPRGPGGEVDYNRAVDLAARTGSIPTISTFAQLANSQALRRQAEANALETKRYHDILAGQALRPHVQMDPPDPYDPTAPRTGQIISYDKQGNVTIKPLPAGPRAQPQQQPQVDPWSQPPGTIPNPAGPGPGASLEPPTMPPGPAMAQTPSPSEQLLAQAEQPQQPQMRGPQFAQAGGPSALPPVTVTAPQPAPPPPTMPSWLTQAQAPAVTGRPREAPHALGPEQRGELRYTTPLGPFNEDAIAHLPEDFQNKVRATATGRFNLKDTSITGGQREALTRAVYAYYPGWNPNIYTSRLATFNEMARGVRGRQTTALNNLTEHLTVADGLLAALQNNNTPALNALVNKGRELTGYQAELPANIKAAAPIIAGELLKVIAQQGGGGVGERADAAANLFKTNAPPKVQQGALNVVKSLMAGQLRGQEQWYENNSYNTDFRTRFLSPAARKIMESTDAAHGGGGGGASGTTSTNVPFRILGQ